MQKRRRILIIDDEESVVFTLSRALSKLEEDYEIVTASSGNEALEYIKGEFFDVIITDLNMPGINGIEFTEAVQAVDPSAIIMWITAYGDDDVKARAERLDVHRYLTKPLNIAEIRRNVQEALKIAARQRKERQRLARDLHDGPIQLLTALALQLEWCQQLAERNEWAELKQELPRLAQMFNKSTQSLRSFVSGLRLPVLEGKKFRFTIQNQIQSYREQTGIQVTVSLPDDATLDRLSPQQQIAALRVVQEALQNVYKHAQASQAQVILEAMGDNFQVSVQDNGRGFDTSRLYHRNSFHVGLLGMQEWADEVQGELTIESAIGQGSLVRLTFPLQTNGRTPLPEQDKPQLVALAQ